MLEANCSAFNIRVHLARDRRHVFNAIAIYYEKPESVHELGIHPKDPN